MIMITGYYRLKIKLNYNKNLKNINIGFKNLIFLKYFKY